MSIKTLQNLRLESSVHTSRALRLFEEAGKLIEEMKNADKPEDSLILREKWLEKDAEARNALKESLDVYNQFIAQLEQINNYKLN